MSVIRSSGLRLYAWATFAFPAGHRRMFREEMLDTFQRELNRREGWRVITFGAAAVLNALSAGIGERRRRRRSDQAAGPGGRLAGLGTDLLLAARGLMRARAFTFVTVASLGVGMGVVMAIVILMRVMTGAPPGIETDRAVEVLIAPQGDLRARTGDWAIETWFYPDVLELRRANTGMAVAGWTTGHTEVDLPSGGSRRTGATWATANYFKTLGVSLEKGRGFEDTETQPVVVVAHRLWQTSLDADPNVLGSVLRINDVAHTIVGVAPPPFVRHLAGEEMPASLVFLPIHQHPLAVGPDDTRSSRERDWVRVIGRLDEGVTISHANAMVEALMAGLAATHPASNADRRATVEPYAAMGARNTADIAVVRAALFGTSGLVLLVVCLNISGMVVMRSARRQREIAVRLALGASRFRLIRYLLAESFVLACASGALAASVLYSLAAAAAWWFDTPLVDPRMRPDAFMLLVSVVICFITSLLFGLMPAIRFSRPTILLALKDESGAGGGRRVGRTQRWTVAIQAAIAVPFLVGAALKIDQVRTTATADLGFATAGLYALPLNESDVQTSQSVVRASLERAPGVVSATLADGLPLDFTGRYVRTGTEAGGTPRWVHVTRIDTRFMETLGIPMRSGRSISPDDRAGGPLVTVLTQPLADLLFPGGDALGRLLTLTHDGGAHASYLVVGVAGDLVASQIASPRHQLFIALAQHPTEQVMLVARSSASVESMRATMEQILPDADRNRLHSGLLTGEQMLQRSMTDLATHSGVALVCGAIALALTALGVFGVVGFLVATRTREIGVRMALGASRAAVQMMVLTDTIRLVVPGVALGLLLGWAAVRNDGFELAIYDLGIVEPLAYAFAGGVTIAVALLSGLAPARRAAQVEPTIAMRAE